jgi:hypothetical protein
LLAEALTFGPTPIEKPARLTAHLGGKVADGRHVPVLRKGEWS